MRSLRTLRSGAISPLLVTISLIGMLLVGTGTAGASAAPADVYRYWGYFTVTDGEFVLQPTGPADAKPTDGAIEAYRLAAPADFNKPNLPRADLTKVTFDSVCGAKEAATDQKRVAVLIDYGVQADATDGAEVPEPEALCAVVPADANGMNVLQAVAPDVRIEKELLCGISGYPATGCADKADKATPADDGTVEFATASSDDTGSSDSSAADDDEDDDSNTGILLGVGGLIVILGAGGLYLSRRNRAAA
ncbi:SCO2322 family protein [Nocardioides jensenii]|uniref:SCO2322 family protein n=1 Tax=Nocardioides jensenii TaxID=1843 RepID=UPI0008305991|nr:SCO2322 family protein [Nocardioides jensenii]